MRPYAKAGASCQAACVVAGYLASAREYTAGIGRSALAKDANDKERIKAERLREALRANLRRRKSKPHGGGDDKSVDMFVEDDLAADR